MDKYAVISIDIEDWYHLEYLNNNSLNEIKTSMLDGLNNFLKIIYECNIPCSFFLLSSLATDIKKYLTKDILSQCDLNSHGVKHIRPLNLSLEDFSKELKNSKKKIEDTYSVQVNGFRAPCFSLDNKRLELIKKEGFKFDSSKINFNLHPLYGHLNLQSFKEVNSNIYTSDNFAEFELPTLKLLNKEIPISGGGYLRIFPKIIYKQLIHKYIQKHNTFFLYIHPFELSKKNLPDLYKNYGFKNKIRFDIGRKKTENKIKSLISILKQHNYTFTTFTDLYNLYVK